MITARGNFIMIKRFSVSNFKGFKDTLTLDLANHKDYLFNNQLIKNNIINKGIIYGKNGSGKSNLGLALYDITIHLTDKQKPSLSHYTNFSNLNNKSNIVEFKYEFFFDNKSYIYQYAKSNVLELLYEKLVDESNNILIYYDYFNKSNNVINIDEYKSLRIDLPDNKLSILKYMYRNTPTNDNIISKIIRFAEGMLWFRCLNGGNNYIGFSNGSYSLDEIIIKNNKIKDFEKFLNDNGLNYKLDFKTLNNEYRLLVKFDNGEDFFSNVVSSGTKALWLYYCWSCYFNDVSFLYLDEFDAFYHYETSELIFNSLNLKTNFQSIVTSHNTYLMKNSLTRPDCCFILNNNEIESLSNLTDKEIREAHNLEKMYRNGAFTE